MKPTFKQRILLSLLQNPSEWIGELQGPFEMAKYLDEEYDNSRITKSNKELSSRYKAKKIMRTADYIYASSIADECGE